MIHFILNIEEKPVWKSCFECCFECCFQTSKTDPNGKDHVKTNLILLQLNSLYTNGAENQAVVCCDN